MEGRAAKVVCVRERFGGRGLRRKVQVWAATGREGRMHALGGAELGDAAVTCGALPHGRRLRSCRTATARTSASGAL